jgi:S-DNA-T family DNA segregation ATPase FtsK/SpoIIIE
MGNCPYLFKPVITDPQALLSVLEELRDELEDRTQAIRNGDPVPRIVVVADEYAGLMVSHSERAEPLLAKMLVLGRAAGVHFVFATQRPDEVVMSPPLRCGFPGRIAFKVAFEEDSRMIIGENGADRLNGKGDFLFRDSTGLHRGQVPYIFDEDFEKSCGPVAIGGPF